MTFQNLYDNAVRLACENSSSGDLTDYAERAPYLLACFCNECVGMDNAYRKAHGMEDGTYTESTVVTLSSDFPFAGIFANAAVSYLASMLVLDENETLSETLFDRYADTLSRIRSSIPAKAEKITDRYGELI